MLSEETLKELSEILKKEYKQTPNLSSQEVFEIAHNLVGFFDYLLKFDFKDKNASDEDVEKCKLRP